MQVHSLKILAVASMVAVSISTSPAIARPNDPAAMIAACPAWPAHCRVDLNGRVYRLQNTLHLNPLTTTLTNGVLDASSLPDGQPAILVSSDGKGQPESYDTASNSIDHLVLTGQSKADGIVLDNKDDDNIRAAAITLENVSISGFRRGLTFGNHAYVFGLSHVQIHNNATGIYTIPNPSDAGERIALEDVNVFNNTLGVDDEGGMELDWLASRLDYNATTAFISGPWTFDGHIELAPPQTPPIRLHALVGKPAGSLYMTTGSIILVNQSGGKASSDYWVQSDSPYSTIQFPAQTYGVRGKIGIMNGPAAVYGPAFPAFNPH
ncbi:hypothetical protein JK176_06910 [Gluconobacter sp. Dm-73]|uniref:hypothetical protein n=1 Tax=Gluconobacter sp. Dm-73 TaxID=2799802 RepID=UPI001B8C99CA|nr:hypothetical protein [Gluconobacter sp. Dm-73]MBS1074608.1 hypothetical protein [Gluconobacter sp. Dm-73]